MLKSFIYSPAVCTLIILLFVVVLNREHGLPCVIAYSMSPERLHIIRT